MGAETPGCRCSTSQRDGGGTREETDAADQGGRRGTLASTTAYVAAGETRAPQPSAHTSTCGRRPYGAEPAQPPGPQARPRRAGRRRPPEDNECHRPWAAAGESIQRGRGESSSRDARRGAGAEEARPAVGGGAAAAPLTRRLGEEREAGVWSRGLFTNSGGASRDAVAAAAALPSRATRHARSVAAVNY